MAHDPKEPERHARTGPARLIPSVQSVTVLILAVTVCLLASTVLMITISVANHDDRLQEIERQLDKQDHLKGQLR